VTQSVQNLGCFGVFACCYWLCTLPWATRGKLYLACHY